MGRRDVACLFNEWFSRSELSPGTISHMIPIDMDEYKILRDAMEFYLQSFEGKWEDGEILEAAMEIPVHMLPEDLNEIAQTIYTEGEESGNTIPWEKLIEIIENHFMEKRDNLSGLQLKWLLTRLAKNESKEGEIWYRMTGNKNTLAFPRESAFDPAKTFPEWKPLPPSFEYTVIDQFMEGALADFDSFNVEIAFGIKSFNYVKDPKAICYVLRTEDDGRVFLDNNHEIVYTV